VLPTPLESQPDFVEDLGTPEKVPNPVLKWTRFDPADCWKIQPPPVKNEWSVDDL
jgi:hypothetical protein